MWLMRCAHTSRTLPHRAISGHSYCHWRPPQSSETSSAVGAACNRVRPPLTWSVGTRCTTASHWHHVWVSPAADYNLQCRRLGQQPHYETAGQARPQPTTNCPCDSDTALYCCRHIQQACRCHQPAAREHVTPTHQEKKFIRTTSYTSTSTALPPATSHQLLSPTTTLQPCHPEVAPKGDMAAATCVAIIDDQSVTR